MYAVKHCNSPAVSKPKEGRDIEVYIALACIRIYLSGVSCALPDLRDQEHTHKPTAFWIGATELVGPNVYTDRLYAYYVSLLALSMMPI